MKCQYCGAEIDSDSVFCTNCGSAVSNNLCPKCGLPLNERGECDVCGGYDDINPNYGQHPEKYPADPMPQKPKKDGNKGLLIGILSGLAVILAAIAVVIVLNVMGVFNSDDNADAEPSSAPGISASPSLPRYNTETPAPTSMPTPTPAAAAAAMHTYRVVVAHVTWDEARDAAVRAGGHLVTINSREEFDEIVTTLSNYSTVKNVWIGACAPVGLTSAAAAADYWNSPDASWITGEPFTFAKWRSGEPSGYDAGLGTEERYIQIFRPKADGGEWSYNDAGNDLSEYKPDTLAYVIEFE